MLITLLVCAYALILFYLYEYTTGKLFTKIFRLDPTIRLSFSATIILSLIVLTSITSYLSLLISIAGPAVLTLLAGAVFAGIWSRPAPRPKIEHPGYVIWVLVFIAAATVLVYSTNAPSNPDMARYQAQSIRWIESYPAVPGLAHIHYHLAENSSWILLSGIAIMMYALPYFAQGFRRIDKRQTTISKID